MAAFAFAGIAGAFLPIGLLVLVLVALSGGRTEPDPGLERPRMLYLTAAAYVGLVVFFAGLAGLATELTNTAIDGSQGFEPLRDQQIHAAIQSGLIVLVGLLLTVGHDVVARRAVHARIDGPGTRLWVRSQYVIAITAMIIVVAAGIVAAFGLLDTIAPDLANRSDRDEGLRQLVPAAVITLAAAAVLLGILSRARQVTLSAPTATVASTPPPPPAPPAGSWAPHPPPVSASPPPAAPPTPPAPEPESPFSREPDSDLMAALSPYVTRDPVPEPEPERDPEPYRAPEPEPYREPEPEPEYTAAADDILPAAPAKKAARPRKVAARKTPAKRVARPVRATPPEPEPVDTDTDTDNDRDAEPGS